MDNTEKLIVGLISFSLIMIGLLIHSETKSKQAMMRELNEPVSYFEAMGIDESFIEGRIFERLKQ